VGLGDIANEHYVLRVQEELNLGTEAKPSEHILSALLDHVAGGKALSGTTLHDGPLTRDAALHLALDIAHKTSWRYATSVRGENAKRATFLRILHTALSCELDRWRDLANEVTRLNDTQLIAALAGEPGGHPVAGTRPLELFSLLSYQAAKAASMPTGPSADDKWLGDGSADAKGSMLCELKNSLGLPEADARRVGALLQRAQAIAALHSVPQPESPQPAGTFAVPEPAPGAEEGWVDVGGGVDIMQD